MEYLEVTGTDPAWNLALEEYVFEALPRDRSYIMLWQNHNTIVVGKYQNTQAEINNAFVRERGIRVVRRLSGGGAVYHDLGNLNFTFITDADPSGHIDLARFCQPVVDALKTFGVGAEISGRNDILIQGRKFSGNAQYVRQGRVMHHGTILFRSDLDTVSRALRVDREKIATKGIRSVSQRVANLSEFLPPEVTLEDFRRRLLECLAAREPLTLRTLTPEDLAQVEQRKQKRYDTWEWNYGSSPQCDMTASLRIRGCGRIEAAMSTKNGILTGLKLSGDFFGSTGPEALEQRLAGCRLDRQAIEARLEGFDVSACIHHLTAGQLAQLLAP